MHSVKQLVDLLRGLAIERQLRAHDRWTKAELFQHQRRRLAGLVHHARTRSRFYGKHYESLPFGEEIDLCTLPITNKRLLMDNFDAVVTDPRVKHNEVRQHLESMRRDEYFLGEYRVVATAGTSGLRGVFLYDRAAWAVVLANALRCNRFAGITPTWPFRTRICTIGADHPMHATERIPDSADVGLFRMLHLRATDPLPSLVDALNTFQPEVVVPYPTVGALLANEQNAGRLRIKPKVVTTHSEVLTDEMIRRMKSAWGITPYNHYGLTEEPHIGYDCREHRGIHLLEDLCIIEIVDENNQPVTAGTLGRKYLLTNLYNRVQPLIRYEVTDMLTKSPDQCPCGRPFPLVAQIGGRNEDVLRLKDTAGIDVSIPPMALTLRIEAVLGVAEFQTTHDASGIHLKVVALPEADRNDLRLSLEAGIRGAIEAFGAIPPPVDVVFVDKLERQQQRMGKVNLIAGASTGSRI